MNRKRVVPVGLTLALTLTGLAGAHSPGQAAEGQPVLYTCEGHALVTVRFLGPYRAVLRLGGRDWRLRNTMAASGSRYEGSGISFWLKGDEALLEQPGGPSSNCRVTR